MRHLLNPPYNQNREAQDYISQPPIRSMGYQDKINKDGHDFQAVVKSEIYQFDNPGEE